MFDNHLCTGGGCICERGGGCIERGERNVSLKQCVLTLGVREKAKILFRPLSRSGERWGLGCSGRGYWRAWVPGCHGQRWFREGAISRAPQHGGSHRFGHLEVLDEPVKSSVEE